MIKKNPSDYKPKIKTQEIRLEDLFNFNDQDDVDDFGFDIPAIQRNYTWGFGSEKDETQDDSAWRILKDLLDFHDADHDGNDTYFLGTVILFRMKDSPRLQIMDGQQRMTSLVALMSMIRHMLQFHGKDSILSDSIGNEAEAIDWANEVKENFLESNGMHSLTPKIENDKLTLDELINLPDWIDPNGEEAEDYLNPRGEMHNSRVGTSGSYLYLAAIGYWRMLKERFDLDRDGEISSEELEELIRFYDTLRYRVVVNRTITEDIGLAYRMFVTANTRGKPLNNFDLFRGLVQARGYELEFSKEEIHKMELHLERCDKLLDAAVSKKNKADDKKSSEIDQIMAYSASVRKGKVIGSRNVSSTFEREIRDDIESFDEVMKLIEFTRAFIEHWDKLDKIQYRGEDGWEDPYSPEFLVARRFERLGIKQHLPYFAVLQVSKWQGQEIYNFIWLIECFVMRTMVARNVSVGGEMYGLMNFAKDIYLKKNSEEIIKNMREHLIEKDTNKNPNGWNALSETHLKDKTAYVLLHATDPRLCQQDPGPNTRDLHAAGLLPRFDFSNKTDFDYGETERLQPGYTSTKAGNWFLVHGTKSDINAFKNSPKYVKIGLYKEIGVANTVEALDKIEDSWGPANIDDRTDNLIKLCKIFYPEDYVIKKN